MHLADQPASSTEAQKCVFLVNPASAAGSTGKHWPEIAHRSAAAGLSGDTLLSERPGQLGTLARQAVADGATLLVVVGGDGTVNEVVNGIADLDVQPEVAIISRGTGWDFIRTFRIPRKVEDAVEVALRGETRLVDLGRVSYRAWDGSDGHAVFANVASAGMSGAAAQRANATTKAFGGKTAYLWAALAVLARWSPGELRVTVDDESRTGRMYDVIVANGRYFGGGMEICPGAAADDGLLDVLTIGDLSKRDLMMTMPKAYRGAHLPHKKAEILRGRVVTVDSDDPVPVELDGEQPGTTPVRFEVLPGRLKLRVPTATGAA